MSVIKVSLLSPELLRMLWLGVGLVVLVGCAAPEVPEGNGGANSTEALAYGTPTEQPKELERPARPSAALSIEEAKKLPDEATSETTLTSRSATDVCVELLCGMLNEQLIYPEADVVEKLSTGLGFDSLPSSEAHLLNAESAYLGEVEGHRFFLGSGRQSGVFSISHRGFESEAFARQISDYGIVLEKKGGLGDLIGQEQTMYVLSYARKEIGLLTVNVGTANTIQDIATISFIPKKIAAAEGIYFTPDPALVLIEVFEQLRAEGITPVLRLAKSNRWKPVETDSSKSHAFVFEKKGARFFVEGSLGSDFFSLTLLAGYEHAVVLERIRASFKTVMQSSHTHPSGGAFVVLRLASGSGVVTVTTHSDLSEQGGGTISYVPRSAAMEHGIW